MTLEELDLKVDAFESLQKHPGWLLLVEEIRKQADAKLPVMRAAKSDFELNRATVEYLALTDLQKAPAMLAQLYRQQLHRQLDKK